MTFNADELEMLAAYAKVRLGDTPIVDALEEYRRLVVDMDALEDCVTVTVDRREPTASDAGSLFGPVRKWGKR